MKRYFQFDELGTNYKTEFIAGLTTFLSMAYVLFVNPATLSLGNVKGLPAGTGMDPGAVFVATALAAAIGSLIMGIFAKYPIALAPGMGINAFFRLYSSVNDGDSMANSNCRNINVRYYLYYSYCFRYS